jgi:hypothetical protein
MKRWMAGPILVLLGLTACARKYSPPLALSPDGETVALLVPPAPGQKASASLEFIDRRSGVVNTVHMPFGKTADRLLWLDHRLYAEGAGGSNAAVYDRGKWTGAPKFNATWYPPFMGTYQGRPALFESGETTNVYSVVDFSRIGQLNFSVRGLSDSYCIRYQWATTQPRIQTSLGWLVEAGRDGQERTILKRALISGMELLGPDLQPIMHLDAPETPSPDRLLTDGEAGVSPDHRLFMIAPQRHGGWGTSARNADTIASWYYTGYSVYEISTGNPLFSSSLVQRRAQQSDPRRGEPVAPVILMNDGVYAVEEVVPLRVRAPSGSNPAATREDHEFWLTRSTQQGRIRIVQLPLLPARDFSTVASASRGLLLIHTYYPTPRLIEVPLKADVAPGEIRVIALRGQ